jgi:ethanolamine transporter
LIVIETLTGFVIIPGMNPINESFHILGSIAIVLLGAFPMIHFISKGFRKQLMKVGKRLGMNDVSAAGMIASLANNILMFEMMKDMDNKGKVLNVAFAVSAAFILGDHLGFTAGINQEMIFPVMAGKIVAGVAAVALAYYITPKNKIGLGKALSKKSL